MLKLPAHALIGLVVKGGSATLLPSPPLSPQVEAANEAERREIAGDVGRFLSAEGRVSFENRDGRDGCWRKNRQSHCQLREGGDL